MKFYFYHFLVFEVNDYEDIKEQNNNHVYYKIGLKYLGRYGNAIREQLGDNFFNEIERTKFSDELIDAKIALNKSFLSTWKIKKIFNNKYEKLCFMIDNKQEFLTISNNSILIHNLNQNQKINIHIHEQIKIISLIKLDFDRVCFSTSNNFIQIIKLYENNNYTNYNYKVMFQVRLNFNAYNLLYLNRERNIEKKITTKNDVDQILFTNNNSIYCIYNLNRNRFFEELTRKDNNIFIIKELPDNHIIYITEDNKNLYIHFFDLINEIKNTEKIEKKIANNSYKLVNFIILKNYCIIGCDKTIYIFDFIQKIDSSFFLDNKLTNIIDFNNYKFN